MTRLIRHIACLSVLFSAMIVRAQESVYGFYDGEFIHLRWKGTVDPNLEGYQVYIDNSGTWKSVTQTKRLVKNNKIKEVVGARTELYLQLAGAKSPEDDFSDDLYKALILNDEAYQFFGAMTVLDANMAKAMGEYVKFKPTGSLTNLRYRVSAKVDGAEQEVGTVTISLEKAQQAEIPSNLTGTGGEERAEIKWGAYTSSAENHVGFYVYRSTKLLGPYTRLNSISLLFSGSSNGYVDNYVEPGTYYYYVTNYNVFGIESDPSEIIEVKVNPPGSDENIYGLRARERSGRVLLEWDSTRNQREFYIHRKKQSDNSFGLLYPISELMSFTDFDYMDRSAEEGVTYEYVVSDKQGNTSDTISFTLTDRTPPAAPTGVKGTVSKTGLVTMSWNANSESDILGYEIERFTGDSGVNNFLLTAKPLATPKFSENLGAKSQMVYRYIVFAIDQNYNRSKASTPIRLRRPDDIPPSMPTISYIALNDSILSLRWTPNLEWDFEQYKVYRKGDGDWNLISTQKKNALFDTLSKAMDYAYRISAVDLDGNESKPSEAHTMTYTPEFNLSPPTNGMAIDSNDHIFMSWEASADQQTIGYLIERQEAGSDVVQMVKEHKEGDTVYLDRHVSNTRKYTYFITAYDKDWYVSRPLIIEFVPKK